jgi:hypothetical protein
VSHEIEQDLSGVGTPFLGGEELAGLGYAEFEDRHHQVGLGREVVEERARADPSGATDERGGDSGVAVPGEGGQSGVDDLQSAGPMSLGAHGARQSSHVSYWSGHSVNMAQTVADPRRLLLRAGVIREVAVRTGRGWRSVLLLGAAFGVRCPA